MTEPTPEPAPAEPSLDDLYTFGIRYEQQVIEGETARWEPSNVVPMDSLAAAEEQAAGANEYYPADGSGGLRNFEVWFAPKVGWEKWPPAE